MSMAASTEGMLRDRVAVISGATGGLGRVAAQALAGQGARLGLLGTNRERLASVAAEIDIPADRLLTRAIDLTRPDGALEAAAVVSDRFGRVDIVMNLIGGWTGGKTVPEVADAEMSDMLARHLWSTFYLARAFVPHLIANRWGRLLAVSSPAASDPPERQFSYVAAKAAQEALMLTLARELRGSGVTANLIEVKAIDEKHERDAEPGPRTASSTTPEEIAAAMLYLCSDEARVVNGARIPLYGAG